MRIPEEFRRSVSRRIRFVMKPHLSGRKVFTECREAAEMIDLTPMTVWYWYEGYHLPNLYNLLRFADLYGVSVDYLLGRTAVKQLAGHLRLLRKVA